MRPDQKTSAPVSIPRPSPLLTNIARRIARLVVHAHRHPNDFPGLANVPPLVASRRENNRKDD